MNINHETDKIVTKEYYVVVSYRGEYLRLNRNEDQIKLTEKTYQSLRGTKEEMIKVYGNLVNDIEEGLLEVPYDDFQLGGILLIRESVTSEEWITTADLDRLLEQVDVKEGYDTSGQKIVHTGPNVVKRLHDNLNNNFYDLLEELDIPETIFFDFYNEHNKPALLFDDGTTFLDCDCDNELYCKCADSVKEDTFLD